MDDKIDLLLINPATTPTKDGKYFYHLGLGYIASYVKMGGYKVKLIYLGNYNTPSKFKKLICSKHIRVIGITALTHEIDNVLRLVRAIKNFKNIPVVLGGPHVSFCAHEIMEINNSVDYIIKFEGEYSTLKLLDYLIKKRGNLRDIPNLVRREDGRIVENENLPKVMDINKLPFPIIEGNPPFHTFQFFRGCNKACKYCLFSNPNNSISKRINWKSTEAIVSEIELMCKNTNTKKFYFCSSSCNMGVEETKKIIEIFRGLYNKKIKLDPGSQIYLNITEDIPDDLLCSAKKIGISSVFFGIESGSEKLRRNCNKYFSYTAIFHSVHKTKEAGFQNIASFIIGLPGENRKSINETLSLVIKLLKNGVLLIFFTFKPFPGTEFYISKEDYDYSIIEKKFDLWTEDFVCVRTKEFDENELSSIVWSIRLLAGSYMFISGINRLFGRILLQIPDEFFKIEFRLGVMIHKNLKAWFNMKRHTVTLPFFSRRYMYNTERIEFMKS